MKIDQAHRFQSFESPPSGTKALSSVRLARLRDWMRAGPRRSAGKSKPTTPWCSALLVPRADEHQGEYVPPHAERLRWLTGFTGSAGMAIIAETRAVLLVDGRYTLQARDQVDTGLFEVLQVPDAKASDWLREVLGSGAKVGFDERLHTIGEIERLAKALAPHKIALRGFNGSKDSPIDRLWAAEQGADARPAPPTGPIRLQPESLAGRAARDKLGQIRKELTVAGDQAVILTLPDSIAWTFNIRGSDVAHNPVALAFAIVPADGKAELFLDAGRLDAAAQRALAKVADILPPAALWKRIAGLKASGKPTRVDPETAPHVFQTRLGRRRLSRGADPCIRPKAIKTEAEIAGARAAHKRDGIAVCRYLAWLETAAEAGGLDEIAAVRKLEDLRRESGELVEISFDTISGSGPNGAIVHYRVTETTNRRIGKGELFLIDSGGQYRDGTTDITRTIAIGRPSEEMRERFTRVLKGHIAIATARFPKGTRGVDLDPFARRALWEAGLDFDHGTGHGVGSYLSVHEGPQSISKRGMAVLEPGMIVSNEPGYYKTGAYGIRIENLLLVSPLAAIPGGEREMMSFETLTLAPIDLRLIEPRLLTPAEITWVDAYHARVSKEIEPSLDRREREWLRTATGAIGVGRSARSPASSRRSSRARR